MDVDEFDVDRGDKLSCPECGANLEVVGLSPVELEFASDEVDEDEGLQGENQLGRLGRKRDGLTDF